MKISQVTAVNWLVWRFPGQPHWRMEYVLVLRSLFACWCFFYNRVSYHSSSFLLCDRVQNHGNCWGNRLTFGQNQGRKKIGWIGQRLEVDPWPVHIEGSVRLVCLSVNLYFVLFNMVQAVLKPFWREQYFSDIIKLCSFDQLSINPSVI